LSDDITPLYVVTDFSPLPDQRLLKSAQFIQKSAQRHPRNFAFIPYRFDRTLGHWNANFVIYADIHSVEYLRRVTGYLIADGSLSATLPLAVMLPLLKRDQKFVTSLSNDKNKSSETY